MPERDIFGAFAREHSKYIYFLLAAAAGATVYALGELDGPLSASDTLAALAIVSWMACFWIGCQRLIAMLKGLYEAGTGHEPDASGAIQAAGSSAKNQLWAFVLGVGFYAVWFVIDNWNTGLAGVACSTR